MKAHRQPATTAGALVVRSIAALLLLSLLGRAPPVTAHSLFPAATRPDALPCSWRRSKNRAAVPQLALVLSSLRAGGGGGGASAEEEGSTAETTIASASSTTTSSSSRSSSHHHRLFRWSDALEVGPPDPILGVAQNFRDCPDPRKVNLVIGAYRDARGNPWILPSVAAAEARLLQRQAAAPAQVNHEYLPMEGDAEFLERAVQFAYGPELCAQCHIAAVQSLSGTGACRLGGQFLKLALPPATQIYLPVPTWGNHWKIFRNCGFRDPQPYRYYDARTNRLDWDGLLQDLERAPEGSVILLHACAHNPTGCDPSEAQWREVAAVLSRRRHIAFFDSAYQGFASGDADRDARALRHLVSRGDIPVLLAQSFAKNFGLYGERCGTLSVVCRDAHEQAVVLSQLQGIIRPMYSSPPKHGSSIVKTVLGDAELAQQYSAECRAMADRIGAMRMRLAEELHRAGSTHDWSHVTHQIGMFAYTGMSAGMVDELADRHAIFLTRDGRISLAGLNDSNVAAVARAVHAVTDGRSITTGGGGGGAA